ncbi:hypothetical protein VSH64_35805 [Amycolatopsis rhabdoformis]|uniref:Uncharacterized protein n=1 Tax=Amycolatopsis rhabdoformis TaxID=1448059 RepID=A0ABZ1I1B8_9PSEU|nr:hypothetical protein [Amycolatopsis rhabdoformis]WSE28169.1 hypothetical protein VSH64_35805 [Amycolatopsis rhabdoformis]
MNVAVRIVEALAEVAGLRLAVERNRLSAVDLGAEAVQIRLIATRLPLPPLLDEAAAVVRPVLVDTEWADVPLRLIVTDVDAAAF